MIAFLRGGELEAVRVATLSLMDRGFAHYQEFGEAPHRFLMIPNRLEVSDPRATETVKRPIEKQVLEAFETPRRISTTLEALENCSGPARGYADTPGALGPLLLRNREMAFQHHRWIAIAVLLSVAVPRSFIALSRGQKQHTS